MKLEMKLYWINYFKKRKGFKMAGMRKEVKRDDFSYSVVVLLKDF